MEISRRHWLVKHGYHNSDCQETIHAGLRISRNKNQEEEIKEHKGYYGNVILTTTCWSSGQIEELCGII